MGSPRLHLRSTDSTNERARELALAGAPSGTVVTADEQTAGRGRQGRRWSAPIGKALLYSAILRPLERGDRLLPIAIPVAVCGALESLAGVRAAIKWPNDIWIEERKVGGVLIEARFPEFAVIGIGVNVSVEPDEFPADLRWPATSVGGAAGIEDVRAALDLALGEWIDSPADRVLEGYRRRDALAEREVGWEGAASPLRAGRGIARGIDDDGNLLVAPEDGGAPVALGAGEVSLRLA